MDPNPTRPSLLLRLRDPADAEAWREFELLYRDLILGYCRRRGLQWSDADDIRQQVMLNLSKAAQGSFSYRPERGRFRNYLARMVQNAIAQHFARPNPAGQRLDTDMGAQLKHPESDATDELWDQEWVRHHFRLAMTEMRQTFEPKSVHVFERLLDGAPVAAVAAEYGMNPDAVYKVRQRIRQRLEELTAAQIKKEDQS